MVCFRLHLTTTRLLIEHTDELKLKYAQEVLSRAAKAGCRFCDGDARVHSLRGLYRELVYTDKLPAPSSNGILPPFIPLSILPDNTPVCLRCKQVRNRSVFSKWLDERNVLEIAAQSILRKLIFSPHQGYTIACPLLKTAEQKQMVIRAVLASQPFFLPPLFKGNATGEAKCLENSVIRGLLSSSKCPKEVLLRETGMDENQAEQLLSVYGDITSLELLYDTETDEKKFKTFRRKVNNKGPTLVLIKNGRVCQTSLLNCHIAFHHHNSSRRPNTQKFAGGITYQKFDLLEKASFGLHDTEEYLFDNSASIFELSDNAYDYPVARARLALKRCSDDSVTFGTYPRSNRIQLNAPISETT